jgi:hypothetical protein
MIPDHDGRMRQPNVSVMTVSGEIWCILIAGRSLKTHMFPALWRSALLLSLFASFVFAEDPFIGKWKLSLSRSKLTGQTIEIQEVSENTYKFKEDEHSDIIFADGLDHPTHFGDSMAITKKSADTWAITYKRGFTVMMNTTWKVSPDGQTLYYTAEGTRPNGQHFKNLMTLKRTSGMSGLAGEWETTGVTLSSPSEIYIAPFEGGGHLISFPERNQTVRMKFDGREYREAGPTVAAGSTSSGRRIDERTIETTEKIKGKVVETSKATISADGKIQTIVVTEPDDKTPVILIYEREGN